MGNLVIDLEGQEGSTSARQIKPLEVYRDISLPAEQRMVNSIVKRHGEVVRVPQRKMFQTKDVNVRAVFNSIRNIFTWIQGERILNPEFGSKLRYYLYEGITPANKEAIAAEIQGVCLKWEPRVNIVRVVPVDSIPDAEDNTVQLDITFTIPSLSDKQYLYSYIYNRTQ